MNSKLLLSKTLNAMLIGRSYYTRRNNNLYSKISSLGNPGTRLEPVLDNWVKDGRKVRFAELQRIIRDLRQHNRFFQALEVSEWMNKKGIFIFSPTEHAVQLDLVGRVHGFQSAEHYFNNLRDGDKNEKTYGALLNCYVRQLQTDKSILHLQKMKDLGFASSALTYNDMMCLYTKVGLYDKVPLVLDEMKENNIAPDNFSYRICINSYGARSDIEGMEKILKEMESELRIVIDWNTYSVVANFYMKAGLIGKAMDALKKAEARLTNEDGTGYNLLITLYAALGNKNEVLRVWTLEGSACGKYINRDYITMLKSLVKLGELEEAEAVLKEWESSGNCYDVRIPNVVVTGYCRKGLYEKAEALLGDLVEKGKVVTPNAWSTVATGYLDMGELAKALDCMKIAFSLHVDSTRWKPNPRVINGILDWLRDRGCPDDVEAFVASLRLVIPMSNQMYHHALLKSNANKCEEH